MYQRKPKKIKIIYYEIALVKKKMEDLTSLVSDITKCSIEAEANSKFTLLTKVNSFRKTKMQIEESIKALDVALEKLENDVKSLGE